MSEACIRCRFFYPHTRAGDITNSDGDAAPEDIGDCRRRSPVATGGMMSHPQTIWPQVAGSEWCGDFELPLSMQRLVRRA